MLTEKYIGLFIETLQSFAKNILATKDNNLIEKHFCLFYPTLGKNYLDKRELLVIGQATRGWSPKFFVNDVQADKDKLVADSIDFSTGEEGRCLILTQQKWLSLSMMELPSNLYGVDQLHQKPSKNLATNKKPLTKSIVSG